MNGEVAVEVPSPKGKIKEQCVADLSGCGDLPNGRAGDCNGVQLEGEIGEIESGNGKDDVDEAYVFVNGSDIAFEEGCIEENSLEHGLNRDFVGNNGELKINGCNGHRDFGEVEFKEKVVEVGKHGLMTVEYGGCNTEDHAQSNGFLGDEVKTVVDSIDSAEALDVVESSVFKQADGVGDIVEKQDVPVSPSDIAEKIPESQDTPIAVAACLSDGKEPLVNVGEVEEQVDEFPKSELAVISYDDSELHKVVDGGICSEDEKVAEQRKLCLNVVVEDQESVEIQTEESKSDLDQRNESAELVISFSSPEGSLENPSGNSDQNVQAATCIEQLESGHSETLSDVNSYGLSTAPELEIAPPDNGASTADGAVTAAPNADEPVAAAGADEPVTFPSADESVTAPSADEPVIAQSVDEPMAEPCGDEPMSAPSADDPMTAPCMDEPVPAPTTCVPETDPGAGEPAMAPTAGVPVTAPAAGEPLSAPTADELVTVPTADEPVTILTTNEAPTADEPEAFASEDLLEASPTADVPEASPTGDVPEASTNVDVTEASPSTNELVIAPTVDAHEITSIEHSSEIIPTAGEFEVLPKVSDTVLLVESDCLILSQVAKEHDSPSETAEGLPSSADCGTFTVERAECLPTADKTSLELDVDLEESSVVVADHHSSVQVIDDLVHEDAAGMMGSLSQCVDIDSEIGAENACLSANDISSGDLIGSEICFGSIGKKELSVISTNDRNLDLTSTVHDACIQHTSDLECVTGKDISAGAECVQNDASGSICLTSKEVPTSEGVECADATTQNDVSAEVSTREASEVQNVAVEVEKRFFNYLIRVPRYDGESMKEQIAAALSRVDEKTQIRDAIRADMQKAKVTRSECFDEVEAALAEEQAARDSLKSKWQEVDPLQSEVNKVKHAMSLDDIDARIRSMEHTLQHVTIDLKEEKRLMREIKQLKQSREQLVSANMGSQDELRQAVEKKEQNEERLKILRKEADLLRDNVSRAELVTKAAKKKLYNETEKLREVKSQFEAADEIRQKAYKELQNLKKQLYEKNKYFWKYRDDEKLCNDLLKKKDRDALTQTCVKQVEDLIKLWIDDPEFRNDYIRCNARSTLRRLGTRDGRSLGPNEEPPNIPAAYSANERVVKGSSAGPLPRLGQQTPAATVEAHPVEAETSSVKPVEQEKKLSASKAKNAVKPSESRVSAYVSVREEVVEVAEEPKRTKEEEEMDRKAEELRKEEEAAKLKEQRRLEEKAKAEAALERKKRNAERALARAAAKAQKEAEQKEKEREKRLKKKERKKAGGNGDVDTSGEAESAAPSSEASAETGKEAEVKDRSETVTKRPQKPSHFTKQQNKVKSIPPPLRNRGKRKMQTWMWGLLAAVLVLVLVLLGNGRYLF